MKNLSPLILKVLPVNDKNPTMNFEKL